MPEPKHPSHSGRPAAERKFVDREEFIDPVHAALKEPQRAKPLVLVYYGGAGIGKSRLRRELVGQMAVDASVVTATLDFAIPRYRQPEAAMLFLRSSIHEAYKVSFPSFDLAYAVLWQKSHPDTPLRSVGSSQETVDRTDPSRKDGIEGQRDQETGGWWERGSLLPQLLDASGKLPLIGLVPRISKLVAASLESSTPRPLDPSLRSWWQRRGERELEDLPQMEPAAIVECLPKLWAADLKDALRATSLKPQATSKEPGKRQESESYHQDTKAQGGSGWMEAPERKALLFIDAYEQLWETGSSEADFFKRDEWVRELVKQLPEALWVICGRQKLRWEELDKDWSNALSQHELKALPDQSARQFLASCGIASEPIQDAIVKGSQGVPHYLDLAVDTVQSARGKVQDARFGGEKPEELVTQFMRHLSRPELEALQVLSAPRYWYYGLFENLMSEYETGYPAAAYDEIGRFSFISEGAAAGTRTMHELMREALQEEQSPELRKRVHLFLHEYYAKQLEGLDVKGITEKHKAALTEAFYHGRQAKSAQELWSWFESTEKVFYYAYQYRLVVPLFREIVQALETDLGPDHTDTASALHALADNLTNQGEYDQAELLYQRALAAREKVLGPEHPDVAGTLSNFSHVRFRQGRFADAEPLLRRAHAITEKLLGADRLETAKLLTNLGTVLCVLGRNDEAEPLLRRALPTMEKAVGHDRQHLAANLSTLAAVLQEQSRYLEAEALYRRAVAIAVDVHGPEHPSVGGIQGDFADLLTVEGKCAEAETQARRSLAIMEKALGLQHPKLTPYLCNLARLCSGRGEYAEADALSRRALAIAERALGSQHPQVASLLAGLATSLVAQGKYAEAEPLRRRSLAIREKALGPEHPDVARDLNGLAWVLQKQGKYVEAEPLARRAIAVGEKVFGPEHPDLAECLETLSALHTEQRSYEEAERLARRALTIREAKLRLDHPDVATTLEILARVCEQTGRTAEAQELSARAQRIRAQSQSVPSPSRQEA